MTFKIKHCLAMCLAYILCVTLTQEEGMMSLIALTAMLLVGTLPPLLRKPAVRRRTPKEKRQWKY